MKKIILTIFVAASFLASCSDAYEVDQPGFVSDEAQVFSTPGDVERGVKAIYNAIPAQAEVQFTSFYTDELGIGRDNLGQGINDGSYQFNLISNNEYADAMWSSYFNIINRVNRIENRVNELLVAATPADKLKYQANLAELYALRAFAHFKLFSYFTPDYTNQNGLSVIKFDFLQTDNYKRFEKRSTVSEMVAFIQSDVDKAKEFGGLVNNTSGYATNAMLEAILIKMYSMVQTPDGYVKLEEAFNRLVDVNTIGKGLSNANSYLALFAQGADDSETIFRYLRVSTDGAGVTSGVASAWYPQNVSGQMYMEIGRSLYNELDKLDPSQTNKPVYDFDPAVTGPNVGKITASYPRLDARYTANVYSGINDDLGTNKSTTTVVATNYLSLSAEDYKQQDILRIGKYTGLSATRPLMNDLWIFRFTDMLLALAEKRAADGALTGTVALGNFSNVESIIYNVRAHRNVDESLTPVSMPTNFSTPQQAYARILEERRLDFAFEGHRYLDMKRLGVKAGSPGFVRHEKDCINVCGLEPSSFKLTMPIPRPEIVANPNMVQNPGY